MAHVVRRDAVFVNCPFDEAFKPLFDAICFTVVACGFRVRSALEMIDSSELRLDKIYKLIEACDHSIHDLSRVELDDGSGLPRFNMPIELGIALGFKRFSKRAIALRVLVMDSDKFRYQKFASDLAGLDISAHENKSDLVIARVRHFLSAGRSGIPSPSVISEDYGKFELALPEMALAHSQTATELTYIDRLRLADFFLSTSR